LERQKRLMKEKKDQILEEDIEVNDVVIEKEIKRDANDCSKLQNKNNKIWLNSVVYDKRNSL
jgi:hypothetical protein